MDIAAKGADTDSSQLRCADFALRTKLAEAIEKSGKSYDEIARKLGVSKYMLYAYTSCAGNDPTLPKPRLRFPAYLIGRLCRVVGNDDLQRHVLSARLRKLLKLAEHELETRKLTRELLRKQKRKAKAKKARRPFIVTGTTTR